MEVERGRNEIVSFKREAMAGECPPCSLPSLSPNSALDEIAWMGLPGIQKPISLEWASSSKAVRGWAGVGSIIGDSPPQERCRGRKARAPENPCS
jgi:hypothetical protein